MARFLGFFTRHKCRLAITALVVILVMAVNVIVVYAGHYYGYFTAYAMGNRYGGAGVEITQGDFANHYYNWCPNDPAAWWLWGTHITTDSSIAQHNSGGGTVYYSSFYLEDIGDPTCSQGNYWVDIYFGRWENKSPSDPTYCYCGGVTSPGYCYTGTKSSCTDAVNFGRQYRGYTGP
jgi:hypothetical protein